MLRRLSIRDFVIVGRLELEFEAGFGALTGETGAGKSIMVDALALALGDRAETGVVREGCKQAEIAAEFELAPDAPALAWLAQNDLADDGACLLRRLIDASGRSRAYINGSPATATQLREIGDLLADIHGQHAHHALLRADAQRALLDAHGGQAGLAREVAALHREWRGLAEARAQAEQQSLSLARERELLEWQLKELDALAFVSDEWAATLAEQRRLGHAAALLEGVANALVVTSEGEAAAAPALSQVAARIGQLAEVDAELAEARELLAGAAIQLDEAAHALRRYRDRLDLDPVRLAELDARIDAVHTAARKHRVVPEELPRLRAQLAARLAQMQALSDPVQLAQREQAAQRAYRDAGARLSAARRKTAAELSRAVTAAMQDLALAGGTFEIALPPLEEGAAHGLENVEFQVAANPNQPLRALAKVASGGELSRIGLAIQVITSRSASVPTLIFDEVDVGIGGGVAEVVGRLLHALGSDRQVLCVTHLPQVAAQADWQWSIAKQHNGTEVLSRVTQLDDAGRIEEIARMLGGVKITDTTRRHAREMLLGSRS